MSDDTKTSGFAPRTYRVTDEVVEVVAEAKDTSDTRVALARDLRDARQEVRRLRAQIVLLLARGREAPNVVATKVIAPLEVSVLLDTGEDVRVGGADAVYIQMGRQR